MDVHEYLVDQANRRGFLGAFSTRSDVGALDPNLELEDLVVGLLQPEAPAEVRVVKLVVRMLQSGRLDAKKLWLRARRERADRTLAWVLRLIPESEQNAEIRDLLVELDTHPPREVREPDVRYDPTRLVRRKARVG